MLKPVYRPRAALDLESIVLYIGEVLKSPQTAQKAYEEIVDGVRRVCEMPTMGKSFCDEILDRDYRWILVENYRIFYRYDAECLTICRVVHVRQDIDDLTSIEW